MATVASVPQVNVRTAAPAPGRSAVSFTLATPVSGVAASYYQVRFSPGSYNVSIHLPVGVNSAQASILWSTAPPSGSIAPSSAASWVAFGLVNSLTSGSAAYPFALSFVPSGFGSEPVVQSDPPPSVVFLSS